MSAELDLAARVVELTRRLAGAAAEAEVVAAHSAEALTRFANSAIHQNVAEATTTVRLRLHLDGRTAGGSTTVTDADGLRSLVERTIAAARLSPPDTAWPGLTPPTPLLAAPGFDEATAAAGPEERATRVREFVRAAGGLETAGYCRTAYASGGFANTLGQAVKGRSADAAMDGIARLAGADGVARRAGGRLTDLDGAELGAIAAAKARAGAQPIELPPGRYEVVLEPTAVADLLDNLAGFGFNGKAFAQHQSFAELGAQQFDESITIADEPLGATLPFDAEGTPRDTLILVEAGVTRAVSHDRTSAAEAGTVSTGHASPASRSWGPIAADLRLAPAPAPAGASGRPPGSAPGGVPDRSSGSAPGGGGQTGTGPVAATARALMAGMHRGLLVTDLWYTRVLDQKSLVVTGLTRNGVWLVENGEVTAAVGNLRFTQSYPQALGPGSVLGIGTETVALPDRWSGVRYTAPALHLASWNFTGNASG
ncbi:TldD/PmbA family protein [Couchioplanes caeruleus]|uniref:Peptidase U62 n=2 Tax=Couchioplanes caeruleus TaxID=56438 RepID=A0A1K0GY97_9ACTN|nr:metallopeptidase TldD-related protein [Couchioplanes caeruleus]OJF14403.1 peptidase U62 [Couchioplanes caeruleus subsp. caeruleus]ROP32019.1 putative Zn-dependent protease [Couchioplanes caeruleus]